MTRDQLEHAIRAACEISEDTAIWIFGSQAVLGSFPDAPEELRASIEVDVQPINRLDKIDDIDGALGELSLFHQTHGFYIHALPVEEAATLPPGWKQRATPVFDEINTRGKTGWCIEVHDLAASKLVAYRGKDRDFVRTLLIEQMVETEMLIKRIRSLGIAEKQRDRLVEWVRITSAEI
jgi:hypothetical protein